MQGLPATRSRWRADGAHRQRRVSRATLLLPVIGREGSEYRDKDLSCGALHLILKEVFGMAAARLRARARLGGAGRGAG